MFILYELYIYRITNRLEGLLSPRDPYNRNDSSFKKCKLKPTLIPLEVSFEVDSVDSVSRNIRTGHSLHQFFYPHLHFNVIFGITPWKMDPDRTVVRTRTTWSQRNIQVTLLTFQRGVPNGYVQTPGRVRTSYVRLTSRETGSPYKEGETWRRSGSSFGHTRVRQQV